jgi:chemotaxis protein CheD
LRWNGWSNGAPTVVDKQLAVGLGEAKVSRDPGEVLVAYGLGSCVGIGMYDPVAGVAGLLHAVLPERPADAEANSPKYVDSGVAHLLALMERAGAKRGSLQVRVAGGANMLTAPGFKQVFNIGDRNVASTRTTLAANALRIRAEDVGGHTGRTVRLYPGDGRMTIRVLGNQERDI